MEVLALGGGMHSLGVFVLESIIGQGGNENLLAAE